MVGLIKKGKQLRRISKLLLDIILLKCLLVTPSYSQKLIDFRLLKRQCHGSVHEHRRPYFAAIWTRALEFALSMSCCHDLRPCDWKKSADYLRRWKCKYCRFQPEDCRWSRGRNV